MRISTNATCVDCGDSASVPLGVEGAARMVRCAACASAYLAGLAGEAETIATAIARKKASAGAHAALTALGVPDPGVAPAEGLLISSYPGVTSLTAAAQLRAWASATPNRVKRIGFGTETGTLARNSRLPFSDQAKDAARFMSPTLTAVCITEVGKGAFMGVKSRESAWALFADQMAKPPFRSLIIAVAAHHELTPGNAWDVLGSRWIGKSAAETLAERLGAPILVEGGSGLH